MLSRKNVQHQAVMVVVMLLAGLQCIMFGLVALSSTISRLKNVRYDFMRIVFMKLSRTLYISNVFIANILLSTVQQTCKLAQFAFNQHMSFLTLQVLFGLPNGLLSSTYSSITILSCYSHSYILHDQTISTLFSLIYVQGSPPHIFF